MKNGYARVKCGCYLTNIAQAVVCHLSPILFITFHTKYDISFSLLGLLVLIGFCTQLAVDFVFSFFSHKFNIPLTVKLTPVLTVVGILIYAILPFFLTGKFVYIALVIGTVVFSASGGLAEVLMSPVIAAIPSENPEHEMSKLHSVYAWGVVGMVLISTLFLRFVGAEYWQWLALALASVPLASCIFFFGAEIPKMETPEKVSGAVKLLKNKSLWLCVFAIFLGGAAECTMSQWCSGYIEQALGIPKMWGDIFGMAVFALTLGLGRTLYSKFGKNIGRVLFFGAVGATACYLVAALAPTSAPVVGLIACGITGFCVSMLWPGSLIVGSDRFPAGGVFIYALMAAGGDLGASVGPQMIGIVTDAVAASGWAAQLAQDLQMTSAQLGMKAGMLLGMIFPLLAAFVYLVLWKPWRKNKEKKNGESLPVSLEKDDT